MPFRYACFLSYCGDQGDIAENFVTDLHRALSAATEPEVGLGVFFDKERLQPGYKWRETLAGAIRDSVCMVLVYTRGYLSPDHPYCACEYLLMKKFERARFKELGLEKSEAGLIIPVVLRGWKWCPPEIKTAQCLNFQDYLLGERPLSKHPKYKGEFRKIAEYIADRHDELKSLSGAVHNGRDSFRLPSDRRIQEWLQRVAGPPMPFVGREVNK
jgi:hypothetical protein